MDLIITIVGMVCFMIVVTFIVRVVGNFLAMKSVYGKFLTDDEIEEFFTKYQMQFKWWNSKDGTIRMIRTNDTDDGYIASFNNCLLAKWHINHLGIIPRWSKWNIRLEHMLDDIPTDKQYLDALKAKLGFILTDNAKDNDILNKEILEDV